MASLMKLKKIKGQTRGIRRKNGKRTKTYRSWIQIRRRCYDPDFNRYYSHGARGITMCKRWKSFENFLLDMGERPSERHSIERVDNDGDYTPENCKWSLPKEQANNKRNNRYITVDGVTKTLQQWADQTGVNRRTIAQRLDKGMSPELATIIPIRRIRN